MRCGVLEPVLVYLIENRREFHYATFFRADEFVESFLQAFQLGLFLLAHPAEQGKDLRVFFACLYYTFCWL